MSISIASFLVIISFTLPLVHCICNIVHFFVCKLFLVCIIHTNHLKDILLFDWTNPKLPLLHSFLMSFILVANTFQPHILVFLRFLHHLALNSILQWQSKCHLIKVPFISKWYSTFCY